MRLFISIDFEKLRDYFKDLQGKLPKDAKLSLTKSFHMTLKFLGDVKPAAVGNIKTAIKSVKFESFVVSLGSLGIFPTENYIRVVWVGVNPEGPLIKLQQQIDSSLKDFFVPDKEFKPHITLARVKKPENKELFVRQVKSLEIEGRQMPVKCFRLVESRLTSEGPVHDDIAVFDCE